MEFYKFVQISKKVLPILLLAVIFVAPVGATRMREKNWTIMVYMDADNNLESYAIQNFLQMSAVGSNSNVNIVVQMDRGGFNTSFGNWTDAKRFYVTKGMTPTPENATMDLGEVDMGNPQVLMNFIIWAVDNYPAKHYLLILWDHGGGWRSTKMPTKGVCWDYTNQDHLTLPELAQALASAETKTGVKIDIIGFDACQMDMIEVLYQIKDYARIAVASEEIELAPGWPYKAILSDLESEPGISAGNFAKDIVADYGNFYNGVYDVFTMAAVNLSKIQSLADAVNEFAKDLITYTPRNESIIAGARLNSEEFGYGSDYVGSIDLYSFAKLIYDNMKLKSAKNVMDNVSDAVIFELHGSGHPNAHGIAIYYPLYFYDKTYEEETKFAADTLWDEFVKQAPHEIKPGEFSLLIGDVMIIANATQNCTLRVVFYKNNPVNRVPDGVKLGKFLEIDVEPKGAIDRGIVVQYYTKDYLEKMGVREDQLIGEVYWDANNSKWDLWEYTFVFTSWLVNQTDSTIPNTPSTFVSILKQINRSVREARSDGLKFDGFVVFVPWHPFPPYARSSQERVIVAMAATELDNYPLPIQYPQWLNKGWNLISIPVIPLKTNISEVLSGYLTKGILNKVEAVWMYDAKTGQWYGYSPKARGVGELKEMRDGVGYWIKMKEPALFTVVGVNARTGPYAPPEYELSQGWNLIGVKSILPIFPTDYLNTIEGKYARLEGYHRTNGAFYPPMCLEPQQGYWIYMKEGGKVPGLADQILINYWMKDNSSWFNYLSYWANKDCNHLGYMYWDIVMWYKYYYVLPQVYGLSGG